MVTDQEAIHKCVDELAGAIQKATAASGSKGQPRADPRPPLPDSVQDVIHPKNLLRRQWQTMPDPALKAQVNRLQKSVTYQLNEWRYDQWIDALQTLDSEGESLKKMKKMVM